MLIRRAIAPEESTRAMMIRGPVATPIAFGVLLLLPPVVAAAEPPIDFDRQVRPLLTRTCFRCHGDEKQRGGLRLDVRAAALKGGESGKPAIKPGDPAGSLLMQRVRMADLEKRMPPKDDPALRPEEIALLERWIKEGARWPEP